MHTILKRNGADNIPTNPSNIDPSNFDPRFARTRLIIIQQINKLAICHAARAAANSRVVNDLNDTILLDVSIVDKC